MNRTTTRGPLKNGSSLFLFLLIVGLFIFLYGRGLTWADDWKPLPWGLNLEQMNQAYQKNYPSGRIIEDRDRIELELQYTPAKTLRYKGGELKALLSSKDPSSPFFLFGYSFEGKFFCQVFYFKDHPELFPETVIRTLIKKYPEGRNVRTFTGTHMTSYFELKSENMYIFSSEKGVFFYDPYTLNKTMKKFQDSVEKEKVKSLKESRENPYTP